MKGHAKMSWTHALQTTKFTWKVENIKLIGDNKRRDQPKMMRLVDLYLSADVNLKWSDRRRQFRKAETNYLEIKSQLS